jgi:hypothetical protein
MIKMAPTVLCHTKVLGGINPVTTPTSTVATSRQEIHLGEEYVGTIGKGTTDPLRKVR